MKCRFCGDYKRGETMDLAFQQLKYHCMESHGFEFDRISKWIKATEQETRVIAAV